MVLFAEAGTFVAGQSYQFRVTVSVAGQPGVQNSAEVTVVVAPSDIVGTLCQGDRLFSLARGSSLRLDASCSFDPDEATSHYPAWMQWHYAWSCTFASRGQSCWDQSNANVSTWLHQDISALAVPTDYLAPTPELTLDGEEEEMYVFTCRVSFGNRSATATASIHTTVDSVPAVGIVPLPSPKVLRVAHVYV
jgi:hypothetical protein